MTATDGEQTSAALVVAVDQAGRLRANGSSLAVEDDLVALARAIVAKNPGAEAVIVAARDVPYSIIVRTMDLLHRGRVTKISFAVAKNGTAF